jgi:hypothetical protein
MDTAAVHKNDSPVLAALALMQCEHDYEPDPTIGDFSHCRGRTKKGEQCKRQVVDENRLCAERLLVYFRGLKELPDDDDFYDDVKQFIKATHCSSRRTGKRKYHTSRVISAFSRWKQTRSSQNAICSQAQETSSPLVAPRDQPLQSIEDDDLFGDDTTTATETLEEESSSVVSSSSSRRTSISLPPSSSPTTGEDMDHHRPLSISRNPLATRTSTADSDSTPLQETLSLGVTQLRRAGTLRDDSPIITKIYRHLTKEEAKLGRVYLLKHRKIDGLFKVGWTGRTAEKRNDDADNCYGIDVDIIYESPGDAFQGAARVEALAHTVLRHQNLLVKRCVRCGKGHREWYKAQEQETILKTIRVWEEFVRMPAYEYDSQGKCWKLSPRADSAAKTLCSFSAEKLHLAIRMHGPDGDVLAEATQTKTTETVGTTTRTTTTVHASITAAPEISPAGVEEVNAPAENREESPGPLADDAASSPSKPRKQRGWASAVGQAMGSFRDMISPSREPTPGVGQTGDRSPADGRQGEQWDIDDLVIRMLLNVMPTEVQDQVEKAKTGEHKINYATIKNGLLDYWENVRTDFQDGFRRKSPAAAQ